MRAVFFSVCVCVLDKSKGAFGSPPLENDSLGSPPLVLSPEPQKQSQRGLELRHARPPRVLVPPRRPQQHQLLRRGARGDRGRRQQQAGDRRKH